MRAPLLRWAWRRLVRRRTGKDPTTRVGAGLAGVRTLRSLVVGKPETVFRGSVEPGSGLQIRVLEPGERRPRA